MFEFILCPSCGAPIGSVYEIIRAVKAERLEEFIKKNKIHSDHINIISMNIDLQDIFKNLDIVKICCRTRLSMCVEFKDIKN